MPNSHENTRQVRLPIRTAARIKMYADEEGITLATASDLIVEDYLSYAAPDIIKATSHLPEPRRALPTDKPNIHVDWFADLPSKDGEAA